MRTASAGWVWMRRSACCMDGAAVIDRYVYFCAGVTYRFVDDMFIIVNY